MIKSQSQEIIPALKHRRERFETMPSPTNNNDLTGGIALPGFAANMRNDERNRFEPSQASSGEKLYGRHI